METRPLILVGGGGHCKSVIEAAESAGLEIAGILDVAGKAGLRTLGYPVIGTDDDIPVLSRENDFVVTLGGIKDLKPRERLHRLIIEAGGRLATVIASTARVSRHASIGAGTVVLHGACVNAGATVGAGCIINTLANVDHDVAVGDWCHVSTGAMVNGGAVIGALSFIGSGAVVAGGVTLAAGTILGAGAVAVADLHRPGIYAGVPARQLHQP